MHIAEFLITTTYVGFIVLFLFVLSRAVRERGRANLDAALFFGVLAVISAFSLVDGPVRDSGPGFSLAARQVLALSLPVLMLRLLDGFTPVPTVAYHASRLGYLASIPLTLMVGGQGDPLRVLPATYFLVTLGYAAAGFLRFARETTGVTRRRMQAIGAGTALLVSVALLSAIAQFVPIDGIVADGVLSAASFATAVAYYLGIVPPTPLRRTWQYAALTEVLRLLVTTPASLPLRESVAVLNRGIASAFGAPNAAIMVWDEAQQALVSPGEQLTTYPDYHPASALVTRVFESQRAQFFDDAPSLDPANAVLYRRLNAYSLLAAPIRAARGPIGVLTLYSPRASVFSSDDVAFLETVSEQIAAFFVRHDLVQQAVTLEAQEEAMRLKEDFLAAAAHDLRTPLTGILGRAQLLLRRAEREPEPSAQRVEDLRALVEEGKRMRRLTEGLLEVSRLEHGFAADRTETDLRVLALSVAQTVPRHQPIEVIGTARALVDVERFRQVLQNLVDNAVKFTPGEGVIRVELESTDAMVRVSVVDTGLGLVMNEVDSIFERFQRGSAAAHGKVGGMGVGLYLCRRIVEEHHGTIRAEHRPEGGARFVIELPVVEAIPDPAPEATEPAGTDDLPPAGDRSAPRLAPTR